MRTDTFKFDLPSTLIAQEPVAPRDTSRLLEVYPDYLLDRQMLDLPTILQPGDLLILNDTKVLPTRFLGKRDDTNIEVTLHKSIRNDQWLAFARPARKLRINDEITFTAGIRAQVKNKFKNGEFLLQIISNNGSIIDQICKFGEVPLPPYIRRQNRGTPKDQDDYQTIFARHYGAVAAPTAGLHFTERLFSKLAERNIAISYVTLHVGSGTFLPIRSKNILKHDMHAEYGFLSNNTADAINHTRRNGGRVIAVGSTSLRLIETAATVEGEIRPFKGETNLFIYPGYEFKAIDLLLTNFHLPQSTLFIMVSAFSGTARMKSAYTHAITQQYRFYSYGDCCLLHPTNMAHPSIPQVC